jgi:site-specific DNA-methyltransferase (adenine-specific)
MIVEQMLNNAPNPLLHIADVSGSALFNADCMDILPLIPDKSVQLILADLPYGTTACKWDSIIPLEPLWEQYKRIIKDNGAVVLFGAEPFSTMLRISNLEWYKYDWIWVKSRKTGFLNSKNRPLNQNENISVFSKFITAAGNENIMLYNPQGLIEINKTRHGDKNKCSADFEGHNYYRKSQSKEYLQKYTNYPTTVLNFNNEPKPIHPTQKPLELVKYLISTYSNENDMILDNTMGVGTTCLGAKELNRHFIGIEKEVKYYELAVGRVFGKHCH